MEKFLCAVEARGKTPRDAAAEFAAKYWEHPRRVRDFRPTDETFKVVGGVSRYLIRLGEGSKHYTIYR